MKLCASRLVETGNPRVRVRADLEGGGVDWSIALVPMAQAEDGTWAEDECPDAATLALVDALAEHLATLSPDLQESFVRSNIMQRRARAWLRRWEAEGRTDRPAATRPREGVRVAG